MATHKFFKRALKTLGISLADNSMISSEKDLKEAKIWRENEIERLKDVISDLEDSITRYEEEIETCETILKQVRVEEFREKQKGTLAENADVIII